MLVAIMATSGMLRTVDEPPNALKFRPDCHEGMLNSGVPPQGLYPPPLELQVVSELHAPVESVESTVPPTEVTFGSSLGGSRLRRWSRRRSRSRQMPRTAPDPASRAA